MNSVFNCVYSCDDSYVQHAGISMFSLLENNKDIETLNIYIIDNNISGTNKKKLESIANLYDRKIVFRDLADVTINLDIETSFSRSSYAELFLHRVVDSDIVLSFDCDTIVVGSIKKLADIDMTDYLVAGVQDVVNPFFVRSIGLNKEDRYINAGGVLVLNLKLWKSKDMENKCIEYIKKCGGNPPHNDQGTINHVCNGYVKILSPCYNLMNPMFMFSVEQIKRIYNMKNYYSQKEIDEAKENPILIHFTAELYNRPWFLNCTHPLKDLYISFLRKSPWNRRLENNKISRNCKIQNLIYYNCPLWVYILMIRFICYRHQLKTLFK